MQNEGNMETSTSIVIGTAITKIAMVNGVAIITSHKMRDLSSILSGVDSFIVSGESKQAKIDKIKAALSGIGYKLANVEWLEACDYDTKNVFRYRFNYSV